MWTLGFHCVRVGRRESHSIWRWISMMGSLEEEHIKKQKLCEMSVSPTSFHSWHHSVYLEFSCRYQHKTNTKKVTGINFTHPNHKSRPCQAFVFKCPVVARKMLDKHPLSHVISLFWSCLPVCDVYLRSPIGIFNDPISVFAVPWSLLLWLSLYFSGFVCIAGPSQCN